MLTYVLRFSSVQFMMLSMRSEKPIGVPSIPSLRSFPYFAFERLQCSSDRRWPSLVLSKKIVQRFRFQRLSPPGNQWCDVLGFVPAGSILSFSTIQIFREASQLSGLLCPPVYLLGRFPSRRHVQSRTHGPIYTLVHGSTPTRVFEGECQPLTHSSLSYVQRYVASKVLLVPKPFGGH